MSSDSYGYQPPGDPWSGIILAALIAGAILAITLKSSL